jgi:hypothetical protein
MPDPCSPISRLTTAPSHRLMHALHHVHTKVIHRVMRGAIHVAHIGHVGAPVLDGACHHAARLAAIGLLALPPGAHPIVSSTPPATMVGLPLDWAGFGGGRGVLAAPADRSSILFSPPDAGPASSAPSDAWRAYVVRSAGSQETPITVLTSAATIAPTALVPLTEPDTLPIFAAAATIVCWLRMTVRTTCRTRPTRV